jgi:hypothetical protein
MNAVYKRHVGYDNSLITYQTTKVELCINSLLCMKIQIISLQASTCLDLSHQVENQIHLQEFLTFYF